MILIRSDQIWTVETSSTGSTNDVGSNKVLLLNQIVDPHLRLKIT